MDTNTLISNFIKFATIDGETLLSGNNRLGNKMAKKLNKIFETLADNPQLAKEVIPELLICESHRARCIAATDALRLGIFIEEALTVLEVEARRNDILGFGASFALNEWRTNGRLPG